MTTCTGDKSLKWIPSGAGNRNIDLDEHWKSDSLENTFGSPANAFCAHRHVECIFKSSSEWNARHTKIHSRGDDDNFTPWCRVILEQYRRRRRLISCAASRTKCKHKDCSVTSPHPVSPFVNINKSTAERQLFAVVARCRVLSWGETSVWERKTSRAETKKKKRGKTKQSLVQSRQTSDTITRPGEGCTLVKYENPSIHYYSGRRSFIVHTKTKRSRRRHIPFRSVDPCEVSTERSITHRFGRLITFHNFSSSRPPDVFDRTRLRMVLTTPLLS